MSTLRLRLVGHSLPGRRFACYEPVYLGVQRGRDVVDLVPGDATTAVFDLTAEAAVWTGGRDFRGPFMHGKPGDRFIYLSWGTLAPDGRFEMFRRAKLRLADIPAAQIEQALAGDLVLEGTLGLTSDRGGPLCAAVRPPRIVWRLGLAL
ncbi:MAG TPA: DUF5990 family protein [Dehalococcoidia bacterium]|nr:DUF5990 family protein [Dehalococcoidia bacterium]